MTSGTRIPNFYSLFHRCPVLLVSTLRCQTSILTFLLYRLLGGQIVVFLKDSNGKFALLGTFVTDLSNANYYVSITVQLGIIPKVSASYTSISHLQEGCSMDTTEHSPGCTLADKLAIASDRKGWRRYCAVMDSF